MIVQYNSECLRQCYSNDYETLKCKISIVCIRQGYEDCVRWLKYYKHYRLLQVKFEEEKFRS